MVVVMLQLPVEMLQGRQPLEDRMWAESVVLPSPTIFQDLRLLGCDEQLSVEPLIPEEAVEGFHESILPWRSRRDVGRAGYCAGLSPVP